MLVADVIHTVRHQVRGQIELDTAEVFLFPEPRVSDFRTLTASPGGRAKRCDETIAGYEDCTVFDLDLMPHIHR